MIYYGFLGKENRGNNPACPESSEPFVEMFLRVGEFIRSQEILNLRLAIHEAPGVDLRTHIRPTCNDLAPTLLDDNVEDKRDILHHRVGELQQIRETHPAYDTLLFPLLFPHGALGWHLAVRYRGDATSYNNGVSCREFAAYCTGCTSRPMYTHCCIALQDYLCSGVLKST
jgi:hypothetical protein